MKPDDRMSAVASFIEGAAIFGGVVEMKVTYRPRRLGERQTIQVEVVGVAYNDNGTSFGELLIRQHVREPHRLYGISLANVDALETVA